MNGLEEAGTGEMRQAACIVAIGLVRCRQLQRLIGLPALDHRHNPISNETLIN
jgi:hypothetical protein